MITKLISKHLTCYGYGLIKRYEWAWLLILSSAPILDLGFISGLLMGSVVHHLLFVSAHIISYHFTGHWYCEPPDDDDFDGGFGIHA